MGPIIRHVVAPARLLFSPGWLAQAEIKLVKRRGKPDARRYGGTDVELIGQQGMGIGRAGQGLEMHWMEVTLAVTNRCPSFPVVSRRPCHAVSAHSALHPMQPVGCTALRRTHMQVNGRDRLPQTSGWTAQPRPAGCMEGTWAVVQKFLRSGPAGCLASTGYAVWYEETQERG